MGKTRENGELASTGLMSADPSANTVSVGTGITFTASSGNVNATSYTGDGSGLSGVVTTDHVLDNMLFTW